MALYAFGRRPPTGAPALLFSTLRDSGALPEFPSEYDSIADMSGWELLGNGVAGDCVPVTWATERRILSGVYPTQEQVWTVYKTQNPNFDPNGSSRTNGPGSQYDRGMVIQDLLNDLVKTGGADGVKAVAFAKVDHTNLDEVKAALATFKCLWLGVNVTDDNQNQFPDQPWTPTGPVEGGHSITATGYAGTVVKMETWASEASLTDSYMTNGTGSKPGVEEAWVVIWPEHIAGLSQDARDALATAYQEVTGKTIVFPDAPPGPGPTPPPDPTPTPTPVPDDNEVAELIKIFKHFVTRFEKWLGNHGL